MLRKNGAKRCFLKGTAYAGEWKRKNSEVWNVEKRLFLAG
jgi:hypothetical protein